MLHVQESVDLTIYLYVWDTGTQLKWHVTNMARNDLRARGRGRGRAILEHVAYSRISKPDNLFICTDNGTAKNFVYLQVLLN